MNTAAKAIIAFLGWVFLLLTGACAAFIGVKLGGSMWSRRPRFGKKVQEPRTEAVAETVAETATE
ncbi:MAG TPA: hypothetical protein PLF13_14170 [candidate division Zixibacteria bacterium]|nr:hypothetical protein [candidate division Zixibacteria bacterium]